MAVSELLQVTPDEELAAKELCFQDCSGGAHIDFEAGCCSTCKSFEECGGWVPYLSEVRKSNNHSKEPDT